LCVAVALLTTARSARAAWIENHVLGDEVVVTVDAAGKALVEHSMTLKTNGNVRLKSYRLTGIDKDAEPQPNCYAIPARDAHASSLQSAVPISLEVVRPADGEDGLTALDLKIDDRKGLRRGTYVFVIRYRTDLLARDMIVRDGAMVRLEWVGPVFDDGFDSARVTFVVPAAPTPPRAAQDVGSAEDEGAELAATYLSQVRRGSEQTEIELMRPYATQKEAIPWAIRLDQRALLPLPETSVETERQAPASVAELRQRRPWLLGIGGGLFLLYFLLVWTKARQLRRHAAQVHATMRPLLALPTLARALLAASLLVAGVALQLLASQPVWGAICVLAACAFAGYGSAVTDPKALMRGPGRWLSVSEAEAFGKLPALRGAIVDTSTRLGKLLLLVLLGAVGSAVYLLSQRARLHALLVGFDAVALLAVFGSGRISALPPDMAVEPARFLKKLARRLAKDKTLRGLRLVPRIRIPRGEMDADELRLLVVPRLPLRGFTGIEVGVSYVVGVGARVALPEILVRVVADSPCDQALAGVSKSGRITPGRKLDERVLALTPRLPTVRMTAEIVAALATRVIDRESDSVQPAEPPAPRSSSSSLAA